MFAPLRRACLVFLAICCLGSTFHVPAPDAASRDVAHLAPADHETAAAVVREIDRDSGSLSQARPAETGKAPGQPVAYPIEPAAPAGGSLRSAQQPCAWNAPDFHTNCPPRARAPPPTA